MKPELALLEQDLLEKLPALDPSLQEIVDFYSIAGTDYSTWSKNMHMHYGLWKPWRNPFNREAMLDQMTEEVYSSLQLSLTEPAKVVDLGCGYGASINYLATSYPHHQYIGYTIVPEQATEGNKRLNVLHGKSNKHKIKLGDYCETDLADSSVDGAYAIESACHASGPDKRKLLEEVYRILKPGATFTVADGFIINPHVPMSPFLKSTYDRVCKNWVLPEMADKEAFIKCLKEIGFRKIQVDDLSYQIIPSVIQSPLLVLKFYLKSLLKSNALDKQSKKNLKGVLFTIILGLHIKKFRYLKISATK